MIIDYYYKFQNADKIKNENRYDLDKYTNEYSKIFASTRRRRCWIYLIEQKEEAGKSYFVLMNKNKEEIFNGFLSNCKNMSFGHGHFIGTSDAAIVKISDSAIELYISKGNKPYEVQLYQLYIDGELKIEIEMIMNFVKK